MVESLNQLDSIFRKTFDLKGVDLKTFSPLTLAYLGTLFMNLSFAPLLWSMAMRQ